LLSSAAAAEESMNTAMASRLSGLEQSKVRHGCNSVAVEKLLASLNGFRCRDAESLVRFHDALLFLRAFPQSRKIIQLTESLLAGVAQQVARLRDSGVDLELLDSEQFSGIAGTTINDTFTYDVARWLVQRYLEQLKVDWDIDELGRQMAVSLPRWLPLLADDSLVEADTPYSDWLGSAAGGTSRILPWLLGRIDATPMNELEKTACYDSLGINVSWDLGDGHASRTLARHNPSTMYIHREPLIKRSQVALQDELGSQPIPMRHLSRSEGEEVLDMVRAALTVRCRELYGTTRGDPESVIEADPGRGVRIFLWGLPPERRLPLRAYHAGLTVKNGVPINYIEGISLFEWMEVGFNTFYAYREGETAWIYSKVLHLLHQLTHVTCFSVYPYQLGDHNEEAIKSGAFWFYRKLGFRPGRPDLLMLTEREEAKLRSNSGYRTAARVLRKLAAAHVFYEFGEGPSGVWDTFSVRDIGLAVQRRMAEGFNGDPDKMLRVGTAELARILRVDPAAWDAIERSTFENFALVLLLVPELRSWTQNEKQTLIQVILAKAKGDESDYLRLLQKHRALKSVLVALGSSPPGASSEISIGSLPVSRMSEKSG
jgi:hypothetical protein